MRFLGKKQFSFVLLILLTLSVFGQIPKRPNPPRLVNDFAKLLTASEVDKLERKLVDFDNSTSVQICIVTTKSIGDYDITQFADQIGIEWGVGTKGKDNGIVIVVKPKQGQEKGKARISVGYGLEGVIPDITAGQIVDNEMIPQFKNEKYYAGLDSATTTIAKFASGEYTPAAYQKNHKKKSSNFIFIFAIIIIGVVFLLMKKMSGKSSNISSRGNGNGLFWILTMLLMNGGGRGGGGGFGGGSSGGGDFGGFGGGDFGGGGAGGEW